MSGRIWGELSRTAIGWSGLGFGTCSAGPVVIGELDSGTHSLRERADRTFRPDRTPAAEGDAKLHGRETEGRRGL